MIHKQKIRSRMTGLKRAAALLTAAAALAVAIPFSGQALAKSQVTIVIDPGHGGTGLTDATELGAGYNGLQEKVMTLATANAMKQELEQYGNVKVYMTRTTDTSMSLAARSNYAKSVGADAVISIHYNASSEHNFYGSEVWVSAFGQHYATGYGIGSCVIEQLSAAGFANKGIKTRLNSRGTDYYGIIRNGASNNVPTIIIEHGYIDNGNDLTRLDSQQKWTALGMMDAAAVAQYYGLKKGVQQNNVLVTRPVAAPAAGIAMPDVTAPAAVSVTNASYDGAAGRVNLTIQAVEPESRAMYYSYSYDNGLTWSPLALWGGGSVQNASVSAAGCSGTVMVRVYNNYELDTISLPVAVTGM